VATQDREDRQRASRKSEALMFEDDGETLRLMKLMRLRDKIIYEIQYGLKDADRNSDLDLIRELELKVEECAMISREINELLESGRPPMEPTH